MNELFGFTRAAATARYALLTPDGFVASQLPGWKNCVAVVNISPALGAKFSQLQITFNRGGAGGGSTGVLEHFVYVMAGHCAGKVGGRKISLAAGGYILIPPATDFRFGGAAGTRLLIFQKKYEALAGVNPPALVVGQQKEGGARPFLGYKEARLQVLLPERAEFDLAVNIFTYEPGATLPFVESHVMEHGILMLRGQGIYRLAADWHPVQAGDAIWMAPFCPQWFVAMGPTPASYIYYKDVNRATLGA